ncbi:ATP-binding protein [Jidongwangia harbinensis]|uniref:ATP-binding protein n=1 Tax=Jidongwangia harbinensis TaxID=2878561 RepID=UPI001CD94093|nr:XRE family transcriptional regulator [Jidongwangia harbinensis]MCA2216718.1 tetratricopeptide repeat protein [Jidongwangia harbinensis]
MFGDVVRAHRRRAGLTQEELAEATGLSVRSIGKLESGRIAAPRPPTVRLLADAFGLAGVERERFFQESSGESGARRGRLAQLPADLFSFAGRHAELASLDRLLEPAGRPGAVVITAVSGTAGVGKTTLAVHWGHRVRDRFPDGQLYVNLRGFDPTGAVLEPTAAVHGFLEALDVAPRRIPADLDGQTALYRSMLADRRMLILLDNARDAAQVRPLLPGAPGCLVLVTSRNQLTALISGGGAHPLRLELLSVAEARDLLSRRLGADRVAAEPQAVADIIAGCARLPLALSIAASRAATNPHLSLTMLAAELDDARTRLDVLTDDDPATDVRAVFSWSYQALSPAAARLFRHLGLHPAHDISAAAAASLAGLPPAEVLPLLAELCAAHLVQERQPGRYTFHDLLRAYATEQAHATEREPDRRAAVHRLLDHYLHTADGATRLLYATRDPIVLEAPQPGTVPERFTDAAGALAWFTAEHRVMLAVLDHAVEAGFDDYPGNLAWTLADFLDRRGQWHDLAAAQRAGLVAATKLGDVFGQARAHRNLARAQQWLRRYDESEEHLRTAHDLAEQVGDKIGQAHANVELAVVAERRGSHVDGLRHTQRAYELYVRAGYTRGQANALNATGWHQAHLGLRREALVSCRQALALYQERGDLRGQAHTWDSLGFVHHGLGEYRQAVECYQEALAGFRETRDRYQEASTLTRLGDTHQATGRSTEARFAWRQAETIFADLDRPEAEEVRAKLREVAEAGG